MCGGLCDWYVEGVVFFKDTATTEIDTYGHTLSLHDALPISRLRPRGHDHRLWAADRHGRLGLRLLPVAAGRGPAVLDAPRLRRRGARQDRKSTRLNSSH